jgi:hypothetical protein
MGSLVSAVRNVAGLARRSRPVDLDVERRSELRRTFLELRRRIDGAERDRAFGDLAMACRRIDEAAHEWYSAIATEQPEVVARLKLDAWPTSFVPPESEGSVVPAHRVALRRALRAVARWSDDVDEALETPREQRERVIWRWLGRAAVLILVAAGLFAAVKAHVEPHATASGSWDTGHLPERVLDGDESTEWLLPDGVPGWLDIELPITRAVRRVRILNGRNQGSPPRAVQEYELRVEYTDGTRVDLPGRFPIFTMTPTWAEFTIDPTKRVRRVRIEVKSIHGSSGSIAEVRLE